MEFYRPTRYPSSSSSSSSEEAYFDDHPYPSSGKLSFQALNGLLATNSNGSFLISENVVVLDLPETDAKVSKKKIEKNMKNPKYAFQTRSQVDILDDGYRWRKYGQKVVKGNNHPRSYYRCTQNGCSVKKQVQRLSEDEGVVVTTYQGVHSH